MAKSAILNANDIRWIVSENNIKHISTACGKAAAALVFWPVSYWILYSAFYCILAFLGIGMTELMSVSLAIVGLFFLALEGRRLYEYRIDSQKRMRLTGHERSIFEATINDGHYDDQGADFKDHFIHATHQYTSAIPYLLPRQ